MRIGIVSDIHEAFVPLEQALKLFRSEGVDAVVTLGDACDTWRSKTAVDVAALLREAEAIGVWGNHDFGLCHEVSDQLAGRLVRSRDAHGIRLRVQLLHGAARSRAGAQGNL